MNQGYPWFESTTVTLTQGTNPESMNPWMMTLVGLDALNVDFAAVATDTNDKNS
jgi:hypothetical protein